MIKVLHKLMLFFSNKFNVVVNSSTSTGVKINKLTL